MLDNIRGLLQSQGLEFGNLVKLTVFLSDMNNFGAMNEVYAKYFTKEPPARSPCKWPASEGRPGGDRSHRREVNDR